MIGELIPQAATRWSDCVNNRDACVYATIIVINGLPKKRPATPPHQQNLLDVALLLSDAQSETADYKGQPENCQEKWGACLLKRPLN